MGENLISWALTHSLESSPLEPIRDLQFTTFLEGRFPAMWQWQNLSVPLTKGSLLCNCPPGTPRIAWPSPERQIPAGQESSSCLRTLQSAHGWFYLRYIWVTSSVLLKLYVVVVNEAHWGDILMAFLVGKASGKLYMSWNGYSVAHLKSQKVISEMFHTCC